MKALAGGAMFDGTNAIIRRIFRAGLCLSVTLALLSASSGPDRYQARAAQPKDYVVMNDRGGLVSARLTEIAELTAKGTRIQIRGRVCLSSCTMFLGAKNICVDPQTRFGFHAPTDHGRPLSPKAFEYWSHVIAAHYPRYLANWYLKTGRHLHKGYYYLTGAQLIEMGFVGC
ncbi:hypothetical protein [Thalassovita sp.]|jgi:hypothetical protein|uniref:hypothetical protein n=1 Tax=Thalassovita sp. TaxID=1979401 RepID=UPI003B5A8EEA